MNLFKKDKAESLSPSDKDVPPSIIGKEMTMVGDVCFKGKLRLDGKIKGNIMGDYLIVGESGNVNGDVEVAHLTCQGRVEGNVNVKKLHVIKGGTINGKVETTDLSVESGAVLNGEIKSRTKDLRLVPGTSIPEEEWEAKLQSIPKK